MAGVAAMTIPGEQYGRWLEATATARLGQPRRLMRRSIRRIVSARYPDRWSGKWTSSPQSTDAGPCGPIEPTPVPRELIESHHLRCRAGAAAVSRHGALGVQCHRGRRAHRGLWRARHGPCAKASPRAGRAGTGSKGPASRCSGMRRPSSSFPGRSAIAARAGQNLMLSAHARGLGTCWVGSPMLWIDTPEVKAELKHPGNADAGCGVLPRLCRGNARTGRCTQKPPVIWQLEI